MYLHEGNRFGWRPARSSVVEHPSIVGSRRVGIEVELENASSIRVSSSSLWSVKNDDSLRNNGRELVLVEPLAGADLMNALNQLAIVYKENTQLHCSERTSLHVHVDVRDLTVAQVRSIMAVYVAVESALYSACGKNRYNNIYCPGITASTTMAQSMRNMMQDNSKFFDGILGWCKYSGINLRAIAELGSIEFRMHEGTVQIERVHGWVNLILSLVEYAIERDPTTVLQDAEQLNPELLLELVFKDNVQYINIDTYVQYYKNNILNLIDIFNNDRYDYTVDDQVRSSGNNNTDVIAALQQAIARQRGE